MGRRIYIDNMPYEKALNLLVNRLEESDWFNKDVEYLPVRDSLGRITAEPVFAARSSPHYVASAMDGVAVKASSTYGATEIKPINIPLDECLEVDTGDYVPKDYDAVIMIEDINFFSDYIQIIKPAVPWQHIRSIGEDLVEGDMILTSLSRIGPNELASFITAGISSLPVIKKPVVAIIPTGTELVESAHENMVPGEIVESNSYMLKSLCEDWGATVIRNKIVVDDKELIKQAIIDIKHLADIIVVCSGSSAGREDYTAEIVSELGELLVHGLAVKPGKPALFGIIDNKPVIGVPGYPISANLIFTLFARPIIYRKMGLANINSCLQKCIVSRKIPSFMGVDEYVNVNVAEVGNQLIAYPLNRGAGLTSILVKSDGVIHIERGKEGLEAGEQCQVLLQRPREEIENTIVTLGSHDMAIDFLADILHKQYGIRLVSTNVGSMGGVMALRRKETHFAGLHLLDYDSGDYNISYLKRYLPNEKWLLINLVKRHQGLVVAKGNPLQIKSIKDLLRKEVRFINRQKGAGTRILLDYLLEKEGIILNDINGYGREEYTHLAVAASVKNDACDAGLAVYASAKAMDLDFIPVEVERYDLCILSDLISNSHLESLLSAINSSQFKNQVNSFGGYDLELSGQIIYKQ